MGLAPTSRTASGKTFPSLFLPRLFKEIPIGSPDVSVLSILDDGDIKSFFYDRPLPTLLDAVKLDGYFNPPIFLYVSFGVDAAGVGFLPPINDLIPVDILDFKPADLPAVSFLPLFA